MDDHDIREHIKALVEEEHQLNESGHDLSRREVLEEQLDQCWDLLRQRQAKRSAGLDPDEAAVRPASTVENYRQ
ncbi:MAG: DUF2630 family protein [Nocardioidaceae bacterium]